MQTAGVAVAQAAAPALKPAQWDPTWSRFAGLYRSRNGDTQVIELNQRLVMINPVGSNPETQIRLEPLGDGRFRHQGTAGGAPVGEVVRFLERDGKVVRMYTGDTYTERVAP